MKWRSLEQFQPGENVRDVATGFTGVIMGAMAYTNGCVQFLVKPPVDKDGKYVDGVWIDGEQLVLVDPGITGHYAQTESRASTPRKAGGASRGENDLPR